MNGRVVKQRTHFRITLRTAFPSCQDPKSLTRVFQSQLGTSV